MRQGDHVVIDLQHIVDLSSFILIILLHGGTRIYVNGLNILSSLDQPYPGSFGILQFMEELKELKPVPYLTSGWYKAIVASSFILLIYPAFVRFL